MSLSLDIASLAAAYNSGDLTPQDVIGEIYARIRARGERPVGSHLSARMWRASAHARRPGGRSTASRSR